MPERDDSRPAPLRAVEPLRPAAADDATARLRTALSLLDGKLRAADGVDGVLDWLRRAEHLVAATTDEELDRTRREIRELIEKLLELNAQVQNVARLKHLLS